MVKPFNVVNLRINIEMDNVLNDTVCISDGIYQRRVYFYGII